MNIHQWKGQIKRFNKAFEDRDDIRDQWNKNTEANLPRFNHDNSLWRLEDRYLGEKEKGMITVGASPCLKKDVHKLKTIDDNFCIMCANSSLKFLLENDVVPDYCITLDSDDIDIPQHLDVDTDKVTLLASTATAPAALDNWKGPIYYMPYYSIDKKLRRRLRRKLGRGVAGGGNSMTQAFYVSTVVMGSRTLIMAAQEYCFDSRKGYYADKKAAKQEKMKTLYPCTDVLDRKRWTQPAHYNYVIWQEKACSDLSPPGFFFDTSFGLLGKDCDTKIHIYDLGDAIKMVKESFANRDRVNLAKGENAKLRIIEELRIDEPESDVYRYDVLEQREEMLRLARG